MRRQVKIAALMAGYLASGSYHVAPHIDYRTPGKDLKSICQDLGKAIGRPLYVSQDLAPQILAIDVKDIDPDLLRAKIAAAVGGSWSESADGWALAKSADDQRRLRSKHEVLIRSSIQNALDEQVKAVHSLTEFNSEAASVLAGKVSNALKSEPGSREFALQVNALQGQTPSSRAIKRLMACFSADELSQLRSRVRFVYSTSPNPSQHPLSESAIEIANQLVAEQSVWADEAAQVKSIPGYFNASRFPSGSPAKVLVGVFRQGEFGSFRIDLKVADHSGAILCQADGFLSPKVETPSITADLAQEFAKPLTADSIANQLGANGSGQYALDPDVRAKILDPQQSEPLGLSYGSGLIRIADSEQVNLVAQLSDQMVDGAYRPGMKMTDGDYLKSLARRKQFVALQDGCLTIVPFDMDFEESNRADRGVLAQFLQGSSKTSFTIEQKAACAVQLPDPLDNVLPSQLSSILLGRVTGIQDEALLKFYGTLSEENMQAAKSNVGLPLAALREESRTALEEVIYGQMGFLQVPKSVAGIMRDPSECLPNGISTSANLMIQVDSQSAIFDRAKDKLPFSFNLGSVTPGELAYQQFSEARSGISESRLDALSDKPRYCRGTYVRYDFQFRLADGVSSKGQLDGRSLEDAKLMTLADLPDDFKSKMREALTQIEKDEQTVGSKPVERSNPIP